MKDFQIQPETNNSVTLWFHGRSVHIAHDHARLYITFDNEELEANVAENHVVIKSIQKVTIEDRKYLEKSEDLEESED